MNIESVFIAVERTDGTVAILQFFTQNRGNDLPLGASWINKNSGWWSRPANASLIESEVIKTFTDVDRVPVGIVYAKHKSWRHMNFTDMVFIQDRSYRDAWELANGVLQHNMIKARNICRDKIRAKRTDALKQLDTEWMQAITLNDKQKASEIEAQRQIWRDKPDDPQIELAQNVTELNSIVASL